MPPRKNTDPNPASQRIHLSRTGAVPLAFEGERIAHAGRAADNRSPRWHELSLYLSTTGKMVLAINYITQWEGEAGNDIASVVAPAEIARTVADYDPCAYVGGFQPTPAYVDRQASLMRHIGNTWQDTVTRFLAAVAAAGIPIAEEV